MIHTNQWSPDTCACVLEFTWDDAVPDASRVHTYTRTIQACPVHALLAGLSTHWTRITGENGRKNGVLADAVAIKPAIQAVLDRITWSWNADHSILTLNFGAELTTTQKNNLQTQANNRYGAGTVVIL